MTDFANKAVSTLSVAIGATRADNKATLQGGDGAKFPSNAPFDVWLGSEHDAHRELCRVVAVSGDTLQVVRGTEGGYFQAWGISTPVALEPPDPWGHGSVITTTNNMTAPLKLTGNTAQALITSGTIATAGLSVSRVSLASASASSVVLQAGTVDGQVVYVENTSATYTVTFAAVGTSNVQDGVSDVIAVSTVRCYVWNATTSHWVHVV
jgi:hypothetical protein